MGETVISFEEKDNIDRTLLSFMIFLSYPGFRKPGKLQDLMDNMVQVQTIQFMVFRWTIWFIRTTQVGTS